MVSMAGISSFIFGTRVRDAPPPLWLGFRSSNGFIISTIVIAIFTVCAPHVNLYRCFHSAAYILGYVPLFRGCACPPFCLD